MFSRLMAHDCKKRRTMRESDPGCTRAPSAISIICSHWSPAVVQQLEDGHLAKLQGAATNITPANLSLEGPVETVQVDSRVTPVVHSRAWVRARKDQAEKAPSQSQHRRCPLSARRQSGLLGRLVRG